MRGRLCRLDDYWFVVVSTDSLTPLLPTCWALLTTTSPGPLRPPLVHHLPTGAVGDHPELWIRATQIRTVTTASLTTVGRLSDSTMGVLDRAIGRIAGLTLRD